MACENVADRTDYTSPDTNDPGSACARVPHELLEMIFETLFDDDEYVQTKIHRMTEIGLVCKA